MGDERRSGTADTPPTLPRGLLWWHERRGLLASGLHSPSRFPSGFVSGAPGYSQAPVTVAGPRRICTGFRVAPFVLVRLSCSASLWTPPASRKGCFQLCFQLGAAHLIRLPLFLADLLLSAEIARVELSDGGHQRVGRTRLGGRLPRQETPGRCGEPQPKSAHQSV